jgi:hypothetical protein
VAAAEDHTIAAAMSLFGIDDLGAISFKNEDQVSRRAVVAAAEVEKEFRESGRLGHHVYRREVLGRRP